MIKRSRSLSKGGGVIDRVTEIERYTIDPDSLKRMLHPKNVTSGRPSPSQTADPAAQFDQRTGRDKPSSFLLHHVKDAYPNLNYDERTKERVMRSTTCLPVRREREERLSQMMEPSRREQQQQEMKTAKLASSCKRFREVQDQGVRTVGDLMKGRQTFHSIDFRKQTMRPFERALGKLESESRLGGASSALSLASPGMKERDPLDKKERVHSFNSYTSREFLVGKGVQGAPEESGVQWYRMNPEKVRGGWKTVNAPKFEAMLDRKLSRHDREGPHWFTRLSYNIKPEPVRSQASFGTLTARKGNAVRSEYPIRLAM